MNQSFLSYGINYPPFWEKKIEISINSEIHPSENPALVKNAINKLFPELKCEKILNNASGISTNSDVLNYFCGRIFEQKILDAARNYVINGICNFDNAELDPSEVKFYLNKQVALVNKVAFISQQDNPPLGPITVKITTPDLLEFIDLFFPKFEWFSESKME